MYHHFIKILLSCWNLIIVFPSQLLLLLLLLLCVRHSEREREGQRARLKRKFSPLQKALHVRALRTYKDDFDKLRKNGEEWLITTDDTETHIPNVYEEVSWLHAVSSD